MNEKYLDMIDRLDESELRHELADALEQIDDYKKELEKWEGWV